jgi:hypothetical protein
MSGGSSHASRQNPRRPWRRLAATLLAAGAIGAATRAHALAPQDRRISHARTGISIEAPAGWALSQHTGYGETVVLMLHPDGSRISVSAVTTPARDAAALFALNRPGLVAQGLLPSAPRAGPRGSIAIDLHREGGADLLRQLYLVRDVPGGRQAVVLTLVSRVEAFESHGPALDFVATRLALEDPIAPSGASSRPDAGATESGTRAPASPAHRSGGQSGAAEPKRDAGSQQAQKP